MTNTTGRRLATVGAAVGLALFAGAPAASAAPARASTAPARASAVATAHTEWAVRCSQTDNGEFWWLTCDGDQYMITISCGNDPDMVRGPYYGYSETLWWCGSGLMSIRVEDV
jgi:hypothetical protein